MSQAAQEHDANGRKTGQRQESPVMTEAEIEQALQVLASRFGLAMRSPVLRSPAELGLDYHNVTFPSQDGVLLEGWFIPAPGSDKIIIANHPLWCSRSGLPAHLEPWRSIGAAAGNDFELNFMPDYKILHDAGYNVLTYDFRNYGLSGAANGGIITCGILEARDVIGSLAYVRGRADLREMTIGLFSRCLGCNATMFAMSQHPEAFEGVRCLVGPQPISLRVTLDRCLALSGIPADRVDDLAQRIRLHTSFTVDDMSPVHAAESVMIPTFLYQVRGDLLTRPSDVQSIYDNIPVTEKKLFWIEGSSRRWDGYAYLAKDPSQMLEWFDTYMK